MSEQDEQTTSAHEAATAGGDPSGKRLTDAEFAEAREAYELGTAGLSDLATQYGISRQALSRRFKDAGAVKGARAHELAAAAKKAAVGAAGAAAAAIERFADRRAEWIEETRITGIQSLRQVQLIARKIVADQVRSGGSLQAIDPDLKAVQRYNKILIDNIAASIEILQANDFVDETTLPALSIEDLTDEDILEHHKNIGALPDDATIEDLNKNSEEGGK